MYNLRHFHFEYAPSTNSRRCNWRVTTKFQLEEGSIYRKWYLRWAGFPWFCYELLKVFCFPQLPTNDLSVSTKVRVVPLLNFKQSQSRSLKKEGSGSLGPKISSQISQSMSWCPQVIKQWASHWEIYYILVTEVFLSRITHKLFQLGQNLFFVLQLQPPYVLMQNMAQFLGFDWPNQNGNPNEPEAMGIVIIFFPSPFFLFWYQTRILMKKTLNLRKV